MKTYNRIVAKIDLDAIEYNMERMKDNIKPGVKMVGVIKTDAYGHGSRQIARMFEEFDYVWGYAVATVDEGVVLRNAGAKKPILVLGCAFPEQLETAVGQEIRMNVSSYEMAAMISAAAVRLGKDALIHIKLDTGMSRLGFQITDESVNEIVKVSRLPHIQLEGMFTHFAKADEWNKDFTDKQFSDYMWMKEELEKQGVTFPYYHCSNSAGIIDLPDVNLDLVRAGITVYGLYPSNEVEKKNVPLKPAMELVSHVSHVKWIEPGTPVSYGGTYVADHRTKIATIPVGYGDGYPRSLSNKGYVLIHGKKAPIVGRVCMDQFMVDVTEIPDVKFMDEVILAGRSQDAYLSIDTLSDLSGRFNYEFVCDLGKRIPREFYRHGELIEQMDFFE